MPDNSFIKKAFFDHLKRMGFTQEHIEVYDEYFDFFLDKIGEADLMDLEPEVVYRAALTSVERLDGEEVVEAYLQLIEYFMAFWAERWEAMHPDEYAEYEEKDEEEAPPEEGDEGADKDEKEET